MVVSVHIRLNMRRWLQTCRLHWKWDQNCFVNVRLNMKGWLPLSLLEWTWKDVCPRTGYTTNENIIASVQVTLNVRRWLPLFYYIKYENIVASVNFKLKMKRWLLLSRLDWIWDNCLCTCYLRKELPQYRLDWTWKGGCICPDKSDQMVIASVHIILNTRT